MKKLSIFVLSIAMLFAGSTFGQTLLVDTNFTTDPGFSGLPASCIYTGGTGYGSTSNPTNFTVADDFIVPPGQSWKLDSVRVFAYQTGSSTTSSFTGGYIKLWGGTPGSGTVLFADTIAATSFVGTGWSGVYRVSSTTLTNTQRPIMFIILRLGGTIVPAGTYWIEYGLLGSIASGPFTPAKTLPNRVNPPNQNGMQKTVATNTWAAALDVLPIGFNMIIRGTNITAINNNNSELPISYSLKQNYPNPFNPSTNIEFDIPNTGFTKLIVYNSVGQVVSTLVNENLSAGSHIYNFDATNLSSGVYMYKLESNGFTDTKKMTLVK